MNGVSAVVSNRNGSPTSRLLKMATDDKSMKRYGSYTAIQLTINDPIVPIDIGRSLNPESRKRGGSCMKIFFY